MIGCRPLTESEFALVLKSFHGRYQVRDAALFTLGVTTGFRISELLSLTIRDVYRHGSIVTRIRVTRRHMKGRTSSRTAAIAPLAQNRLQSLLARRSLAGDLDPGAPLFVSQKDSSRPISRVQAYRILKAAFEYCELDIACPGTHTMRKTFADRMYTALDHDIFRLQKALGHKSPGSTVAYLSFNEQEIDQAVTSIWSEPTEEKANDQLQQQQHPLPLAP